MELQAMSDVIDFDHLLNRFGDLPDTRLIRRAFTFAHDNSPTYLCNHVARSWVFADRLGQVEGKAFDREVVAVSALLHDIGLTDAVGGPHRFEVTGANAAADFVRTSGFDDRRAQLVWDSIALHAEPSIAFFKETEVSVCARGISVDFGAPDYQSFEHDIGVILEALPRRDMKNEFKACVCHIAETRPETTYENFIADFGRRFVPGYVVPSVVDFVLGGSFTE
jgi:hypothetical protein